MNNKSQWIWHQSRSTLTNSYVEFRKTFETTASEGIYLTISGCQEYLVYMNGKQMGRGPSPCTPEWQYYDTYDATSYMNQGKNVISVVCYHFGEKDIVIEQMQGEAGFIAALEGPGLSLLTDESWKCRISPRWETKNHRISQWSGFNEIYLATKEDGWEQLDYNDTDWETPVSIATANDPNSPWPHLIPREIPMLHKEIVNPQDIVRVDLNYGQITHAEQLVAKVKDNADIEGDKRVIMDASQPSSFPGIVFDFAREVVGRPFLQIQAAEGGVIRLAYGESLELQYVDTFILKHGLNTLMPYGRRACRYLQISVMATPQPIELQTINFEMTHYDFEESGTLETSEPLLNQIWEISKYTTQMNSHDHLEDCPWREKALWVADAVVMGKVIYHLHGDTLLLRKSLLQGARIQNEDGSIPGTGPEKNKMLLVDFCSHWLLGVYDYWKYTSDDLFIEEIWENLKKLMSWFEAQEDESGLFEKATKEGFSCFIDWTANIDRRDKVTAISCLYYKAMNSMIELAQAKNDHEYAEMLQHKAIKLRSSIRDQMWLQEEGAFSDCVDGTEVSKHVSLQTNFLAIWSGLMEGKEAIEFVTKYYNTGLAVEVKGAFFQHIVLEVLIKIGLSSQALSLIKNYWGGMVSRGATTWWETYDHSSPHCVTPSTYLGNVPTYLWEGPLVSMCHAWGASPAYILDQLILGVNVLSSGFDLLQLSAPLKEVSWAKGTLPSKHGWITIEWKLQHGEIEGTVRYPQQFAVEMNDNYPKGLIIEPY